MKRNKVRFFIEGFTEKEGLDYHETFSLVSKIIFIRLLLSFVAIIVHITYIQIFNWKFFLSCLLTKINSKGVAIVVNLIKKWKYEVWHGCLEHNHGQRKSTFFIDKELLYLMKLSCQIYQSYFN